MIKFSIELPPGLKSVETFPALYESIITDSQFLITHKHKETLCGYQLTGIITPVSLPAENLKRLPKGSKLVIEQAD